MATEDNEITTVSMKKSTKERLAGFGEYGDSMDDILNKLMDRVSKR